MESMETQIDPIQVSQAMSRIVSSGVSSEKQKLFTQAVNNPVAVTRELNRRSLYHFLVWAWPEVSNHEFESNWHIKLLCKQLEQVAYRVVKKEKHQDLIINIPPGTTKTITCSIVFPMWCWTQWYWMRFICASYAQDLSLESAEYAKDLVESDRWKLYYPELTLKEDKKIKSNFKIVKTVVDSPGRKPRVLRGGNRFSCSVGGRLMGFHGDILIWDDPLDTQKAVSDKERETANRWIDQTLPTRKTNKRVSTVIGIMQRLHQDDPTGHILDKHKKNITHFCLPGEIRNYKKFLKPPELEEFYVDDLLDPSRLGWDELLDQEADLGQYGFAGQYGQNPVPPGGGMFKVDHIRIPEETLNPVNIEEIVRYWDKAGTADGGAYTTGVKLAKLTHGRWLVMDVVRGQWASEERERIIKDTAIADGMNTKIMIEQEPGSGGKESADNTIKNLVGFYVEADLPKGDKTSRADPLSVQVNRGNVMMLRAMWNQKFIDELRNFPFGTYKDQVDAVSAGFNHLAQTKVVRRIT